MTSCTVLGAAILKEAGFILTTLMSGKIAFTKRADDDTFIAISVLDHVAEDLNVTAKTAKIDDQVWIATRYTNAALGSKDHQILIKRLFSSFFSPSKMVGRRLFASSKIAWQAIS